MSNKSHGLTDAEHQYLVDVTVREHPVLQELRRETMAMPMARMQIAPEQGQFIQLQLALLGAKRCIEVGVFTGYSSLATALALPDGGQIVACDVSEEYTAVARRYWERAGVAGKIDLRLAPAIETLDALLSDGQAGSYDFAFIDADKENYVGYYQRCFELVRPGGLIGLDNALWSGRVAETDVDEETRAIQEVNTLVGGDDRVECCLVPIGDGLLLARKK